tara:strand:- start:1088 stop:1585 length:498 start_codon:yes stop_codon:yes gene_type:complete
MSDPSTAQLIIDFNEKYIKDFLKGKGNKVDYPEYTGPRKKNKNGNENTYELIFDPNDYPNYYRNKYTGSGKIIVYDQNLTTLLKRLHELCHNVYNKKFIDQVTVKKISFTESDPLLSDAKWTHEDVSEIDNPMNTSKGGKRKTRRGRRKSNRKSKKNTKRRTRKH